MSWPVSLTMTRFGSFVEKTTFTFPKRPGLYFMQGVNLSEPRLEANGAGKTTIWKALTWCLYGKDPRGLKAGDVANWESPKDASVRFSFVDDDDAREYTIARGHSPNYLSLWDTADPSTLKPGGLVPGDVEQMVKLDFAPWLNCVLMAQGQPMFLDLGATAKAALFSDVMGLDRWVSYAEKAGKLASAADGAIRAQERAKAETEGRLAGLGDEAILEALRAWEEGRKRRLDRLAEDYERDVARSKEAGAILDLLRHSLVEIEAEFSAEAGEAKRCPTCHQLVRSETIDNLQGEAETARRELRRLESEHARLERSLDQMEDQADDFKAEENPHQALADKAARQRRELQAALDEHDRTLAHATERASMLGFWVRGFKDIRLEQISSALEELEIEVNSCVMANGLVDWELQFEVDRESKSGSLVRGFSVYVKSPHNDRPVPWESWSGGEAQRLRVSTQEGLANLIRNQTGASIPLEVWDEPTTGLSPQGVRDLLDALSQRARDEQRIIFVVDHRSLGYAGFDGTATVSKTEKGSTVDWDY